MNLWKEFARYRPALVANVITEMVLLVIGVDQTLRIVAMIVQTIWILERLDRYDEGRSDA